MYGKTRPVAAESHNHPLCLSGLHPSLKITDSNFVASLNANNMEKYLNEQDIKVLYVQAASFPMGVGGAFQKLHSLVPDAATRTHYGISHMNEHGQIVYKAAVEESFAGEAEKLGCETLIIRKGTYASKLLIDWKKDESIIGKTFQKLLQHPELDKKGYCLEIYKNGKDVLCLVPLTAS
jgi:predicted transcriptional regulator YdeE